MNPEGFLNRNQNEGNMLTLNISGLQGSGKCALKLNSSSMDISRGRDPSSYGRGGVINGGALTGSIRISDLSDPITSIVLVLIRREIVGNNITNEKIEFGKHAFGLTSSISEHTLIGYVDPSITRGNEEQKSRDIPRSRWPSHLSV